MIKAVKVPFGVMEVHLRIIVKTLVHRMIVIRGIKSVANGRIGNAFSEWKVSSLSPMLF